MDEDDTQDSALAQLDSECRRWHDEWANAAHNTWFEHYEEGRQVSAVDHEDLKWLTVV